MKTIGDKAPILFADRQARSGLAPLWAAGKNGKEYRATMGRKPIGGIFSVGVEEPYRWKDSVQNEPEIRMWVLDGIANGLRPWFTKFSGTLHDKRWLPVVEKVYDWHFRNERYLRNEEPLARVAMVYSQQTAHYYGGTRARQKVEDHTAGYYQALIEARIPFEMVHDRLLDAAHIDRFKVLILPNIAALSEAQCAQLRDYVDRGGSLVATYETSLYDEWGVRRADFGLADLFGASYDGKVDARMQNSYLRLEGDPGKRHPILRGLDDAGRIINGVSRVHTRTTAAYPDPPLTLIPSYPDLPMEEVFPRVPKTDIPEVFVRQNGQGPRGLLPLGHRPHLLGSALARPLATAAQRGGVGRQRTRARLRHRPRNARCHHLAPEGFAHGSPGEPHQPDDDEGTAAGTHSRARAAGHRPPARRCPGEEGSVSLRGGRPARASIRRCTHPDRSLRPRHRSDRDRPVGGAPSGRTRRSGEISVW